MIEKWWNEIELSRSKLYQVVNKLKSIKQRLKVWNFEPFGYIFENKRELEEELENLNKEIIEKGMNLALYEREKCLMKDYEDILTKEELF